LPFRERTLPALVALIRNIETDKPQGIQRTALNPDGAAIKRGGKTFRMTLGPMAEGAIKIDADENVTTGLSVGEGLESTLAGRQLGHAPAWALINNTGIRYLPVPPGIEALTLFCENDAANRKAVEECGTRWVREGREVFVLNPDKNFSDLNDELRGIAR
jgi:putative DNA primase/helicase